MEYNLIVQSEDSGKRIDLFLVTKIQDALSRSFIQRLINEKMVLLNGVPIKPHHKVRLADRIAVRVPRGQSSGLMPEDIKLDIVYEDDDILVINKPSGLVVHPGSGNSSGTLINALLSYTKDLSNIHPQRPGIVHRLDKETSGLILVAKNNSAHLKLAKQFERRSIKKKYVAIVRGQMEFDEGVIDLPIGRHKRDFRLSSVNFGNASRYAITRYKVLRRLGKATVLELMPKTGRTHQLRVHLAHLGHPILGDTKYGRTCEFKRLALHAKELGFFHPRTNDFMNFSSNLPLDFVNFLKKL